ncbi:MAG: DUF106 domain-containing protein, partial [Thermoplasmata archaeon]|nr:DUF106 domain-containing protein [Thermoplasmata archaeon]
MMSRNTAKLENLGKLQPEIMKKTMKSSTGQLKPMMFTMVIIILFFAWLSSFLMTGVPYTTFSVPWNYFVPLRSAILFPYWIMLYFLTSLPSGMMLQRVFKYFSFKKKIRQMEEDGLLDSYKRRDDKDQKKDKGKGRRERAEAHFNCTICSNNVRKGSWAYRCKCGKYYHEHCLPKIRKCSTCGNIISED